MVSQLILSAISGQNAV